MDVDQAREFLHDHHRAVMLTYRADGDPQLSPVLTVVGADGCALVSTREGAMKVGNIARDPRTSLCVLSDAFFGPWVRIDGRAQIVRLPDAMELLVDYFRRISGEHDDWDEYRAAMREERRVIVRIGLDRVGPTASG